VAGCGVVAGAAFAALRVRSRDEARAGEREHPRRVTGGKGRASAFKRLRVWQEARLTATAAGEVAARLPREAESHGERLRRTYLPTAHLASLDRRLLHTARLLAALIRALERDLA
jgi:hypothetical protein